MFRFNFGGDSPDVHNGDVIHDQKEPGQTEQSGINSDQAPQAPPQFHDLSLLDPRKISYTRLAIGQGVDIPRRDLFDARFQLMAEDSGSTEDSLLLGSEDVRGSVYEGGLKVWEGALDLARYLSQHGDSYGHANILELGCGAALPACLLLYQALKAPRSDKRRKFVLADYNVGVLRLVTMPNVVLSWLAATDKLPLESQADVDITEDVITEFQKGLLAANIELHFVSGGWSPEFSRMVGEHAFDVVLGSETIYSPRSTAAFTDAVVMALAPSGRALIAAKRVYFGVGGTLTDFLELLPPRGLKQQPVDHQGDVGRVIVEVTSCK